MIVLPEISNNLPETSSIKAISSGYYTVTAYNSEVGQCDSTPCITANGFNVCEHGIEDTVAANWLPFGAKNKDAGIIWRSGVLRA
jgi:hypothetical protein